MRVINLENLRSNLGKELENLPFKISKRGIVIAEVNSTVEQKEDTEQYSLDKYDDKGNFKTYFK